MTLIAALLAITVAGVLASLLIVLRRHDKATGHLVNLVIQERASADDRINKILAAHAAERATTNPDTAALIAMAERLAQRLQAPEQAVLEHALQQSELAPHPAAIQPDDDLGYWAKMFNETKEDLAERLAEEEVTVGS